MASDPSLACRSRTTDFARMPSRLDDPLGRPAVLALLWAAAVAAMAVMVRHFWIPLDDGTLAQSAHRVLLGQLPQRDFGDPYSGLNAVLGALALRAFGDRLASLRVPLVVGFAAWLPALWLLARRFLPPAAAVAAVLLAAILSVPTYPAAMPTWFALFAVTWGVWCVARFLEGSSGGRPLSGESRGPTGAAAASRLWLVGAGVLAGAALLFKVVGLYFVAAALLSLVLHRVDGSWVYRGVALAGVAAFLTVVGRLVIPISTGPGIWHFFVPAAAVGALVVWRAWAPGRARHHGGAPHPDSGAPPQGPSSAQGLGPLFADGLSLSVGVLLPVALFLVPYAASGALGAWFTGVFVLPARRFQVAASPPGPWWTAVPGVVSVGLAWWSTRLGPDAARRTAVALAGVLAVALALDDALGGWVMAVLWYAVRGWMPALSVWAAVVLSRSRGEDSTTGESAGPRSSVTPYPSPSVTLAVVATAALWTLVEFPYAAPAYFFYVAPLGVLATGAVLGAVGRRPGPMVTLLAAVAAFLGAGYGAGVAAAGDTLLHLPRGGILVPSSDADTYERLAAIVGAHVDGGGLWAGPDAPEVYYLTGHPNPTPTLYEFLDPAARRVGDLDTLFTAHEVRVVVLNKRPLFSEPVDSSVVAWLFRSFPRRETVGPFSVLWKDAP